MTAFFDTVARHRKTLGHFPRFRDRALYIYGRIVRRFSFLPGKHTRVQVHLRGQRDPFHLRLGSTDWLVIEEIFINNEYTFVRDALKSARWILDLGANVGYSLRYWQSIFPDARMVAMEPESDNCLLCSQNIVSAGLTSRVKLLQAGAGACRAQMRLVDSGEGEWAYRTEESQTEEGRPVEIFPLAEVLENYASGQKIDLLKCDIEGAERELFEDCRAWIGQVNAIVIELHPPYTLPDLLDALKKAGADFEVSKHVNRKTCPVVMLSRPPARF
jgi:FkbM family methyltransferase